MIFKIINPSDPYTLEAERLDIAAVTVILLGRGNYALEGVDNDLEVPIFSFGSDEQTSAWLKENCGFDVEGLGDFIGNNQDDIATCLESVVIGRPEERQEYIDALTEKLAGISEDDDAVADFKFQWHDKRRSSMNDIGGRAQDIAKRFRDGNP